jgi:hypothetical protein
MEIESGGSIGAGAITFATSGSGTLWLDESVHFGGLIAGFGLPDQLDLTDISFNSGTTSASYVESAGNTSGMLTVTDGTHSAHLTLLGNYVTGNSTSRATGWAARWCSTRRSTESSTGLTSEAAGTGTGTGDVTLLGQAIAGNSTSNGGPSPPQGNGLNTPQVAQVDYNPLVITRHT